ncbi:MAG: PH domain-containing protein [Candidatus Thorarchaeota archaeon]|nr:PH domain-containing protein [Candidatus Thorarchaeota archaeon]
MTHDEERVIRPPIDQISSGRVFQPTNAFLYKKMLKVGTVLVLIWFALRVLFIGFTNPTFLEIILALSQPLEILVMIGWETTNIVYVSVALAFFIVGSIYSFIYVRRIEYSVLGWEGDAMPEIYTRKGIINITKKHVPFRTIVNVRTRKGIFDRLFGIGTVLIETAGGSTGVQPTGLISVIIQRLRSEAEEKIEGIKFHEELRDFILREMRFFGRSAPISTTARHLRNRRRVLTRNTLDAFIEIRDVLRESER